MALGESEGFVKIVAASTLISELALSIDMGEIVEDLAMTIHPHLTLGEVIMETYAIVSREMKWEW